jgi:hypothetical protein
MIFLPKGGVVIDTPGMREFHIWNISEGAKETFPEIEALALQCHFRDCTHTKEKNCAILAALAAGYALGHLHVAGHVVDWCCALVFGDHRHLSPADLAACTVGGFLLLLLAFALGPRRTYRAIPKRDRLAVLLELGWCAALIGVSVLGICWMAS